MIFGNLPLRVFENRLRNLVGNRVLKITLAITFLCNSRCSICSIWKVYHEDPAKLADEVSKEDLSKLFNQIGKDFLWIEITGGEPFLKENLVDITECVFNNTGIVAGSITTNGLLPDKIEKNVENILERIPGAKNLIVGVSIDGLKDTYEKIRGLNEYDRVLDTFLRLKEVSHRDKNLIPHIAYTFSRYNAGNFREFYETLNLRYGIGIDDFTFTLEHQAPFYRVDPSKENLKFYDSFKAGVLADINYINLLLTEERFHKLSFQRIREDFYHFYLNNISTFMDDPTRMVIPCSAGKYSAYIDSYGNVYPCAMWDVCLGNIKDREFCEIWESEKARDTRRLIRAEKCPICWTPCEAQPSWIVNLKPLKGLFLT